MADRKMEKEPGSKNKEYKRLIISLAILVGIMLIFTLYLAWPLLAGKAIVLATRPIDPFEVLRGQYISINFEISVVPTPEGAKVGDDIFVALQKDSSGIWRYRSASLSSPAGELFIKGTILSAYGNETTVRYGIEQYFFERNAELPTRDLTVEAKLTGSGRARISRLLHNGTQVEIKYQEPRLTS
jgi:uncharacterized membrane-anchored protein